MGNGRWRAGPMVGILCWLLVVPLAVWAVIRTFGLEREPVVQVLAFTPYAAIVALVPLVLAVLVRRWWAAAVAAVAALALAIAVVPRAIPTEAAPDDATGAVVRVMTANLFMGDADPAAVVALVREHEVDVLALQEFTPGVRAGLHRAGLVDALPYDEVHPVVGSTGSALYSRFPLHDGGVRINPGNFRQAYATVEVAGAEPVYVESVHTCAPLAPIHLACWWADFDNQLAATPDGPARVLAGDFNATLDHAVMRRLIGTGYRDAAAAVGAGLVPTWGPYARRKVPPVTLDRVLVDGRIGVQGLDVYPLRGGDHRAVIATLTLPAREVQPDPGGTG